VTCEGGMCVCVCVRERVPAHALQRHRQVCGGGNSTLNSSGFKRSAQTALVSYLCPPLSSPPLSTSPHCLSFSLLSFPLLPSSPALLHFLAVSTQVMGL